MLTLVALMTVAQAQGTSNSSSKKVSISGTVRDAKTKEALPFVNVGLMRETDTVFMRGGASDFEGRFSIGDIKPGKYLLQASCVGYENYTETIEINKSLDKLEINLTGGTMLQEVQVTAKRPLYLMDGEKNMYNTKEDPSIQTGTASDALQNAPGVEVDAEGNITLRGVSSVEIWVNDRPSHMNEEALKQYIKQLPANAIERIEVITNPSARYSTSGGVINIVTNQTITRNELLCVGLQATTTPMLSPWISYVWANEKVDFNLYLNGRYGTHEYGSDGTNTLLDANGDTSRYQSFNTESNNPNIGGYVGFNINWNIDSMTHLSAWMGAYPGWSHGEGYSDYTYREFQPTLSDLSYTDSAKSHNFWGGGYAGVWYEHRYDTTGRKLSLNFNGSLWSNNSSEDQWRRYSAATARDFDRQCTSDQFSPSARISADYTLPLKHDITIEFGGELNVDYSSRSETIDSLLPTGEWNNMQYRSYMSKGRSIAPNLYATAQKRWGGFTAKLGLRYYNNFKSGTIEHTAVGDKMRIDTLFSGLIPTIHFSYQTKTFESYSISYTRRFAHSGDLSNYMPFRIYSDYSFRTGNPNLLMCYTHNLEAAFNKYVMGFGNVGLNAYWRVNTDEQGSMVGSTTDAVISPYLVNYTYPVNIGSSHTEGVEASITYRPTGFLNVRLNASLFNYGFDYDGYKESKVSYSFRLNIWTKLWQKLELFANAHYTSPRLSLYRMSVANKGVDFGVSSDFFNRKLSVYLNVNDIFGMAEWGENTTAPNYQTTGSQHFNSRFVSVGLTWRIGKMELENKARQGATDNTPRGN
ncbi:MAG: TonB-dependent receptor [Bacteroidales bacterium]|nr:TonB-dependent receptor [Bacteroidales bacterium]